MATQPSLRITVDPDDLDALRALVQGITEATAKLHEAMAEALSLIQTLGAAAETIAHPLLAVTAEDLGDVPADPPHDLADTLHTLNTVETQPFQVHHELARLCTMPDCPQVHMAEAVTGPDALKAMGSTTEEMFGTVQPMPNPADHGRPQGVNTGKPIAQVHCGDHANAHDGHAWSDGEGAYWCPGDDR